MSLQEVVLISLQKEDIAREAALVASSEGVEAKGVEEEAKGVEGPGKEEGVEEEGVEEEEVGKEGVEGEMVEGSGYSRTINPGLPARRKPLKGGAELRASSTISFLLEGVLSEGR